MRAACWPGERRGRDPVRISRDQADAVGADRRHPGARSATELDATLGHRCLEARHWKTHGASGPRSPEGDPEGDEKDTVVTTVVRMREINGRCLVPPIDEHVDVLVSDPLGNPGVE